MSSFNKQEFVPISIEKLVVMCSQFAQRIIAKGDILPPKDWFEDNDSSGSRFYWFDAQLQGQRDKFFLRLWKMIRGEENWSPTLPNAFALRCMALFAERHLRLAFLNGYDTTTIMLSAVDEDRAFYWALTSFWRYSDFADRMVVVQDELQRLRRKHDILLLSDKWQRGQTGDLLELEQNKREERDALQAWKNSVAKVVETEARISRRKKKEKQD